MRNNFTRKFAFLDSGLNLDSEFAFLDSGGSALLVAHYLLSDLQKYVAVAVGLKYPPALL